MQDSIGVQSYIELDGGDEVGRSTAGKAYSKTKLNKQRGGQKEVVVTNRYLCVIFRDVNVGEMLLS